MRRPARRRDEIVDQKAREAIDKFVFVTPIDGNEDHCVFIDGFIVLSVSIFCEDVCQGVEEWLAHVVATRPDIQSRIDGLMRIFTPPSSGVMGST